MTTNFFATAVQRIHFEPHWRGSEDDEWFTPEKLKRHGIAFAYVDGPAFNAEDVLAYLGEKLHLENPPYDPRPVAGAGGWWRFEDDLITLSMQAQGLIVVVGDAERLFADRTSWVFDLIDVFVANAQAWASQGRLAHLYFMMQPNERLRASFSVGA